MKKIIIYTANYGNYDTLKEQLDLPNTTYICFTDNPSLRSKTWKIIYDDKIMPKSPPRLRAKFFKVRPYYNFPDGDITIWIDSSYQITSPNFVNIMTSYLSKNAFAIYKHPARHCLYQEARVSMNYEKYFNSNIAGQIKSYSESGMPPFFGLWAAGLIVRRNTDNSKLINSLWWDQIIKYTIQDQISLPYVLWKNNLFVDTINLPQYDNTLYTIHHHLKPNQ